MTIAYGRIIISMEKNILLTIEYDGTRFYGWQRQPSERTVQGTIESLLTEIVGTEVSIDGTSRTDAGVHALGQRATFRADFAIPVDNLAKVMNDRLAGRPECHADNGDIRIVRAEEVPKGFHARRSAIGKKYRYAIRNANDMPAFDRNYRYLVPGMLDIERMREAAEYIKGTHDFACFQASGGEPGRTTVRTITSLEITKTDASELIQAGEDSGNIRGETGKTTSDRRREAIGAVLENEQPGSPSDVFITIEGDGFLYNMVRIITGTLVEVGLGKRAPGDLEGIIDSGDRTNAGHTAPPQGLTLVKVFY